MALDEAQLLGLGPDGAEDRCLRLTTWTPPGFSLGWFQTLEQVPSALDAHRCGVPVVRRQTGGGAIFHEHELTFSLTAPLSDPLYVGPIAESYRLVHAWIAEALAGFGVQARLRDGSELASDRPGTGLCFHHSSSLDLVWERTADGRLAKGVGSAQRRRGGRVLHHGSIKCAASTREPGVATIEDGGTPVSPQACGASLAAVLGKNERPSPTPGELAPRELEHALGRAAAFAFRAGTDERPTP